MCGKDDGDGGAAVLFLPGVISKMTDEIQPREHDSRDPPAEAQWHLDKKVPLSLIFALIVQTVVIVIAFQDVKKDVELLKAAVRIL